MQGWNPIEGLLLHLTPTLHHEDPMWAELAEVLQPWLDERAPAFILATGLPQICIMQLLDSRNSPQIARIRAIKELRVELQIRLGFKVVSPSLKVCAGIVDTYVELIQRQEKLHEVLGEIILRLDGIADHLDLTNPEKQAIRSSMAELGDLRNMVRKRIGT